MAEKIELELNLKNNLEGLKDQVKNTKGLSDDQAAKVNKGLEVATKAFNSKDWNTFIGAFNDVVKIVSKNLASASTASAELKKALDLKQKAVENLSKAQATRDTLKSRYTSDNKLEKSAGQNFYANWLKEANTSIKSSNNQTLGLEEVTKRWADNVTKYLEQSGKKLAQLTNAEAQTLGFGGRQDLFTANKYFKAQQSYEASGLEEIAKQDKAIAGYNNEIATADSEIKRLQAASGTSADEVTKLYNAIIELGKAANENVSKMRGAERREGGGGTPAPSGIPVSDTSLQNQSTGTSSPFAKAFKQFTLYAIALRTIKKALREAAKTVKELDRALTEQAMVTGLTRKQTYGLLKDYQNMASRLGTTTKEVSSTMTQFLRQGRSINESLKLTEAAVSAAKVAGISSADSINYLTTAINGFRLSANDAMKVSDKFAAVAATAATSYEEIAIALSKVAAQANLAGMSIDYTTALLTKGIETTREAPETIGTALKTVIARMRELTDYGETLEGDTNINNVESQLAYIGIQLRDNNGELRSTEDVLNDLGKQWDKLNANQQAAVAKALAGTRQQSRLIAMMQDYERVTELQQIAERSSGATMAQMATYMEGMDAALNKVSVAWEKIVSTISNSDVIIGIIDTVSFLMESINGILSNTVGMVTTVTILSVLGLSILGNKMKEFALARQQQQLMRQEQKMRREDNVLRQKNHILALKDLVTKKQGVIETYRQAQADTKSEEEKARYQKLIEQEQAEINKLQTETIPYEEKKLGYLIEENQVLTDQSNSVSKLLTGFTGLATPILMVISLWRTLHNVIKQVGITRKRQQLEEQQGDAKSAAAKAPKAAGEIIGQLGVYGIPIALAVAAALGAAIMGISYAISSNANNANNTAKDVNKLSKQIYDLNKKTTELDSVIDKFEAIDNKVLKTNKDLQEMQELLASAADSLSDEEKEAFKSFSSLRAQKEYLESVRDDAAGNLNSAREKQRQRIRRLRNNGGTEWNNFLTGTDTEIIQARDAMYALNNSTLYNYIDNLKQANQLTNEAATTTEKFVQALLDETDAAKAAALMDDPAQIEAYVDAIKDLTISVKNAEGEWKNQNATSILTSDDSSIHDRVRAFKELRNAVEGLGDPEIAKAFESAYSEWATFADNMSDDAYKYLDSISASIDSVNELGDAIQKLGYNTSEATSKLNALFSSLNGSGNLKNAITDIFNISATSEEFNDILNAFDKAFGTTILNMGQNVDKLANSIDSLYEKASKWGEMSETDRTSFLSEHADLFKGDTGAQLLKAFESGNYNAIHAALLQDEALLQQQERLLADVNRQLDIEYARSEAKRDYAYIRELEAYKKQLQDVNKLFLASLKQRYEQQQEQLDAYKDYLQKETDALTDALEKRKQAYQDYFDAINREEEANDYEEKARLLVANISRLGSSMNADAAAKRADLAQQLDELEKERLKELRQQAQEAMIKSIEDEVTKINDNLEKLLNNEQALLTAMTNDAKNPSAMIASLLSAQFASGNNTELGMQNYLQQMQATFAAIMPNVDWSNIDVKRQGDSLILNIMGRQVQLNDGEQQTIYDAIQTALRQLGYN